MFKVKIKRMIASLMLGVVCLGLLLPQTVYATNGGYQFLYDNWGEGDLDKKNDNRNIIGSSISNATKNLANSSKPLLNNTTVADTANCKEIKITGLGDSSSTYAGVNFSYNGNPDQDLFITDIDPGNTINLNDIVTDEGYYQNVFSNYTSETFQDFDTIANGIDINTSGNKTGHLNSLNQRMALMLYAHIRPSSVFDASLANKADATIDNISNSNYKNALSYTLDYPHEKNVFTQAVELNIEGVLTNDDQYSYSNFGALLRVVDSSFVKQHTNSTTIYNLNAYGCYMAVAEFMEYVGDWMVDTTAKEDWKADTNTVNTLVQLKTFNDLYAKYIPIIGEAYETKIPDAKDENGNPMSLHDMVESTDAKDATVEDSATLVIGQDYQENFDQSTPIGKFYIINSDRSIVDYTRDDILADIDVDDNFDIELKEKIKEQRQHNNVEQENLYEGDNKLNAGDAEAIRENTAQNYGGSAEDLGKLLMQWQHINDKANYDIDTDGIAHSSASVTMSDYIVTGMMYSATFIPMRTNLYSPDTIAQFDEDFRNAFYYKYGFMRKALLIDTSGSSAVDYYNANGKLTGDTRVATLRDLIESGDNDVTLYIDPNFYNAEEAATSANNYLDARNKNNEDLVADLTAYSMLWEYCNNMTTLDTAGVLASIANPIFLVPAIAHAVYRLAGDDTDSMSEFSAEQPKIRKDILSKYDFDIDKFSSREELDEYITEIGYAVSMSNIVKVDDEILKTNGFSNYSNTTRQVLSEVENSGYINPTEDASGDQDSLDNIVLPSREIDRYMKMETTYERVVLDASGETETIHTYTTTDKYSPMLSFAYVSTLYRDADLYSLANCLANNNPVFMASDDLCKISEANQWYRNSLLNYALIKNLESNVQVDYNYVTDLDMPIYMDVFGNIITESGTVVVPAASNATLHLGTYKDINLSSGLYSIYGKEYSVPVDLEGAGSVMASFFIPDLNAKQYVINGVTLNVNGSQVSLDKMSQYDTTVQSAIMDYYREYIVESDTTNLNWMAMVNISNEVMRGAPLEFIDIDKENLATVLNKNKAAITSAAKLESLIDSFNSRMSNTLIAIPDFSRMDSTETYVALFIKILMAATVIVIIIGVYRDGVAGNLGIRTLMKSLWAIALTVIGVVVVPAIFQLTYYGANKFLLHNECMRILMINTEKHECGIEIGMTESYDAKTSNDFAIQLDWISVPWYKELDYIVFDSTLDNLQKTKLEAYRESEVYSNTDVELYNDGVYINTNTLFDSVDLDYTFTPLADGTRGLYYYANDSQQTAGFYSPYYVFLRVLTANVNEYNEAHNVYNYTTKYVSGNRLKTVGLCYNYFTSDAFINHDEDIMHLYQIYGSPETMNSIDAGNESITGNTSTDKEALSALEDKFDRAMLFSAEDISLFQTSMWYNSLNPSSLEDRALIMDNYARDFIVNNKDLLNKVTDETFIKVMALHMAIKYNQLFGINSANALEIYNMDSNDIIRVSTVKSKEAALAVPMSYPRYVYNFGGEASVYAATILTMIMWLGSFIKPICTVIAFISIFASIWVFRVVLQRPSANLWGYLITTLLLCLTNFLHAILLKIGMHLPDLGLPMLGCLIFLIIGQITYLLALSYVTGVALKDWANLGMSQYEKDAAYIKHKFGKDSGAKETLSGRIKHHENNWDYYTDLISQHRARNAD